LKKCKHCHGKDGKQKDVYETFQSALDTASHIEKTRGIYLTVYKCPLGNGWHLTSNDSSYENYEKETLFHSNEIPIASYDGSWEYINGESDDNNELVGNIIKITRKKKGNKKKINKKPDNKK